jgi:hypothetical protein
MNFLFLKARHMTDYHHDKTEIASDGLRYTNKKNGSPFQGMGHAGETMSCMKCGQHKRRSTGSFKRYLGANLFFCGECKPLPKLVSNPS